MSSLQHACRNFESRNLTPSHTIPIPCDGLQEELECEEQSEGEEEQKSGVLQQTQHCIFQGGGIILPHELISYSLHFSGVLTVRSQNPSGVCGGDHRAYSDVTDNTARTGRIGEVSTSSC